MQSILNSLEIIQATEEFANVGYWHYDLVTKKTTWSALVFEIYGVSPDEVEPNYDLLTQAFIDEDRDEAVQLIQQAITQGAAYNFTKRIKDGRGSIRTIRASGYPKTNQQGESIALVGMIQDVSKEFWHLNQLQESQRLLEAACAVANIGQWRLDLIDQDLYWSDEVFRIHGYEPGEITPNLELGLLAYHPDDRERVTSTIEHSISIGKPYEFEARIQQKNGAIRHVKAFGELTNDGNKSNVMFGIIQDITEQLKINEQSRLWNYLVNETPEAVVITDSAGFTVWVNGAFEKISGYTLPELIGRKPGKLLQGPDSDPATIARISSAIKQKTSITEEILNYSKVGDPYWILLSIFPRFDDAGEVSQFMAIEVDISDRVTSEQQLTNKKKELERLNFQLNRQKTAAEDLAKKEELARTQLELEIEKSRKLQEQLRIFASKDEMTGIANRRYYLKRAEAEFVRSQRYKNPVHIVIFDIDHFKKVNDQFGHPTGDQTIIKVTEIVMQNLRESIDLFGRLGGEEFGFLLPATTQIDALAVVNRIRENIANTEVKTGLSVTCSFGVCLSSDFPNLELAMAKADEALYLAKNNGRNRVEYWSNAQI